MTPRSTTSSKTIELFQLVPTEVVVKLLAPVDTKKLLVCQAVNTPPIRYYLNICPVSSTTSSLPLLACAVGYRAASARQSGWQPCGPTTKFGGDWSAHKMDTPASGMPQFLTGFVVSFSEDRRALTVHQLPSKLCALPLDARVQVCDRRVYRQRFSGSPSSRSALRYAGSCAVACLHIRTPPWCE